MGLFCTCTACALPQIRWHTLVHLKDYVMDQENLIQNSADVQQTGSDLFLNCPILCSSHQQTGSDLNRNHIACRRIYLNRLLWATNGSSDDKHGGFTWLLRVKEDTPMGCICSKEGEEQEKEHSRNGSSQPVGASSVQLVAPTPVKTEEVFIEVEGNTKPFARYASLRDNFKEEDSRNHGHDRQVMSRVVSVRLITEEDLIAAGWPQWLTSAAPEAIRGWLPRRADHFERLEKIGQGTYSSVYKARDLDTGKIVAMKKVRFMNMDPDSVRFMAREIHILRRLDHPNVMKLQGIVTSRISESFYLVFDYMEHDLAGLAATPEIKFTESQIKCFIQQLFRGLQHCHQRGVLHRDIKGSNILINNDGVLKIGDFGLANFYHPNQKQALTSRVATLWYRAPELLFGCSKYGAGIDLWSAGCIIAELFAGVPIMPGRTEVEQIHNIFKLCGSPSNEYWQRTNLPKMATFKPQNHYKRRVLETFKHFPPSALALVDRLLLFDPEGRGSATSALSSEFFKTEPLPCNPSSLPKYPPSKELDAKVREEQARRQRADTVKGRRPESIRRGSRDFKTEHTPEFITQKPTKSTTTSYHYNFNEKTGSGLIIEPPKDAKKNGFKHSASMIHVGGLSSNKSASIARREPELRRQGSHVPQNLLDLGDNSLKKGERDSSKDFAVGYRPKRNRMNFSGPLMPPGGNLEDLLKEHERQIQQAVRKTRLEKSGTKTNMYDTTQANYQALYAGR